MQDLPHRIETDQVGVYVRAPGAVSSVSGTHPRSEGAEAADED